MSAEDDAIRDAVRPLIDRARTPEFMARLTSRIEADLDLLERIERGPDRIARIAERVDTALADRRRMLASVMEQLVALPLGQYDGANRYDTDDEHVLTLWANDGTTHDIRWPRATDAKAGEVR